MASDFSPSVVVASLDPRLLDEVVRRLEELPHWRVMGAVTSLDELSALPDAADADALLVADDLAIRLAGAGGGSSSVIVFSRVESAQGLRAALDIGARGFITWPSEIERLKALVESGVESQRSGGRLSPLTALWSPKGGSGSSTLSAHLAGEVARLSSRTLLVDLDLDHADQTTVLGAGDENSGIADLVRVADELSQQSLDALTWQHAGGFRVLLAPGIPGEADLLKSTQMVSVLQSVRERSSHVIADVPSGYRELVIAVAEQATTLALVVTPDVLALKRARDAMKFLRSSGIDASKVALVLNQWFSADISVADAEAVVGISAEVVVNASMEVFRAVGRGELASSLMTTLAPLAHRLEGSEFVERKGLRYLFGRQ